MRPLPVSESSWSAIQKKRREDGTIEIVKDSLRQMRSLLNKLTLEKFEALVPKLCEAIEDEEDVNMIAGLIFDKAITYAVSV